MRLWISQLSKLVQIFICKWDWIMSGGLYFFPKIVIHLEIIFFTLRFPLYVCYWIKYLIFVAKMTHVLLNENEIHWFTNFIWILTQYNQSILCQFLHFFYSGCLLALFSDKQGDQNSSKLLFNLLSNLEEREHLTLELWGNIAGVALIHMPVLKQSLCSRGCGAFICKTCTSISEAKEWLHVQNEFSKGKLKSWCQKGEWILRKQKHQIFSIINQETPTRYHVLYLILLPLPQIDEKMYRDTLSRAKVTHTSVSNTDSMWFILSESLKNMITDTLFKASV